MLRHQEIILLILNPVLSGIIIRNQVNHQQWYQQYSLICYTKLYSRMKNFLNNLSHRFKKSLFEPTKRYLSTPVGKITLFNSLLFVSWHVQGVTSDFLIKNFTFDREHLKLNTLYTAFTYAFSHFHFYHFAINMAAIHFFGKKIQLNYGSRYVWALYLTGAIAGSFAMNYFMPYYTINLPKVGADPAISALFSFFTVLNPRLVMFNLGVPVRLWFLLLCGIVMVSLVDSSGKNLGGLAVGVGMGLLKRGMII